MKTPWNVAKPITHVPVTLNTIELKGMKQTNAAKIAIIIRSRKFLHLFFE